MNTASAARADQTDKAMTSALPTRTLLSSFASLRVRLLLLVLLAVLPGFALILYGGAAQRAQISETILTDALRLTRLVATNQQQSFRSAEDVLGVLAQVADIRAGIPDRCLAFFNRLLTQYPSYHNFGLMRPNGDLFCLAGPPDRFLSTDRSYLRRALATRQFAVGDYAADAATRDLSLPVALPIVETDGQVSSVLVATLDLTWLRRLAAEVQLPPGSAVTVIERSGTILMRDPEGEAWTGRSIADTELFEHVQLLESEGTFEAVGVDGVRRLYAFTRLPSRQQGMDQYVVVGVPTDAAYDSVRRLMTRNLLGLAISVLFALAGAWFGSEIFVLRQVRALVTATRRLSAGDLTARTGITPGHGELSQLAVTFDDLAASLQRSEERRRVEDQLRGENERLEQLNRTIQDMNDQKTEFVSLVSHELRTPLTSIKGYVDIILGREVGDLTEDQDDFLRIVKTNADRLIALINDLLDISRIEAGRVELKRVALDLNVITQHTADTMRPQLQGSRQQLTLKIPTDLPLILGDHDRVTQILTNLLSNAHKYTPSGGALVVSAIPQPAYIRVDIRDSGVGLTTEEQARLFTKFFRAANRATQAKQGTGLGLAITRSLVELHGGRIWVISKVGEGTTFSFTLPRADAASPDGAARPASAVEEPDRLTALARPALERANGDSYES